MDKTILTAIITGFVTLILLGFIFASFSALSSPTPPSSAPDKLNPNPALNASSSLPIQSSEPYPASSPTSSTPESSSPPVFSSNQINNDSNPSSSTAPDLSSTKPDNSTVNFNQNVLIFNSIWPSYYRDYLRRLESAMRQSGFLKDSDSFDLNTESGIYSFLDRSLLFYRDLANLSAAEFSDLQAKFIAAKAIKAEQKLDVLESLSFLPNLPKLIIDFIFSRVYASYSVSAGLCYKDNAPADISTGYASPIWCCNCGYEIRDGVSRFMSDCGSYGVNCDIQIGCLNGVCEGRANGIWDPTTTMCGCG